MSQQKPTTEVEQTLARVKFILEDALSDIESDLSLRLDDDRKITIEQDKMAAAMFGVTVRELEHAVTLLAKVRRDLGVRP